MVVDPEKCLYGHDGERVGFFDDDKAIINREYFSKIRTCHDKYKHDGIFICSACGSAIMCSIMTPSKTPKSKPNFCPNCGAINENRNDESE